MSAFRTNRDMFTVAPAQATAGPALGVIGAFEAAYDNDIRSYSWLGAQNKMREREEANFRRIREIGEEPPATLNNIDDRLTNIGIYNRSEYFDYMKALTEGEQYTSLDDDEGRTQTQLKGKATSMVAERNERLKELKAKYPDAGIETYEEMFSGVVNEAEASRRRWETSRTGFGGTVGGLAGSLIAGVNPDYNPLNFLTLGVGGFGKTLIGRLATEAGAQGAIETVNQFTGTRDNQRVLGMDPTGTDALYAIGGAALGGAAIRGVGESIGFGVRAARRWFTDAPNAPAPPQPTPAPVPAVPAAPEAVRMSGLEAVIERIKRDNPSRVGRAAAVADVAHAQRQLDSWSATAASLSPAMSTRLPRADTLPLPELNAAFADAARGRTVDELAREADPATFKIYDKLADRAAKLRETLATADKNVSAAAALVDERIASLTERVAKAGKKTKAKLQAELDELTATRQASFDETAGREAGTRRFLQKTDEKMRDLAPTVSRAYARARNEWTLSEDMRSQIDDMIAKGGKTLPENPVIGKVERGEQPRPPTLEERAPVVMTIVDRKPNESALDALARKAPLDAKLIAANTDQLISIAAKYGDPEKLAKAKEDAGGEPIRITVEGHEYAIPLDEKIVTGFDYDENGQLHVKTESVMQMFRGINEDQAALKALGACSTVKTS